MDNTLNPPISASPYPRVLVDGSYGEGGGQIIRTCLSLAALTGQAVEIVNVRAGRAKPGLQPQHLTAVRAAASLCAARLEGDAAGSTRLLFAPQAPAQPGVYRFDIGTAGAATLVAQTVLLPLAHAESDSRVTITGGTHVPHAPPADYLEAVYLRALARAGVSADFEYSRAGYYPKGGGETMLKIAPAPALQPLNLSERGRLRRLDAFIVTSNLPEHVSERGAAAVEKFMKDVGRSVSVERRDRPSPGTGAAVVLAAECEGGLAGFTAPGERGKPMEKVAQEACEEFMRWWKSGAACDEHLADQLVLPMALVPGESRWTTPRVTEHLRTVLCVAQQFLPIEYTLDERPDGPARVTLRGSEGNRGVVNR
jgi:RNA 3'-terminal phosphate cyclase (ATP)